MQEREHVNGEYAPHPSSTNHRRRRFAHNFGIVQKHVLIEYAVRVAVPTMPYN